MTNLAMKRSFATHERSQAHNQTDAAKALLEAVQAYKADVDAITTQAKQEFVAKGRRLKLRIRQIRNRQSNRTRKASKKSAAT